jgi:CCR4-NOT complex subunit CAF16
MTPAIAVSNLTFSYSPDAKPALVDIELRVERGRRCLLLGANGAGKTSLLRVLAGKHMVPRDQVTVLDKEAFDDTSLAAQVEYLGGVFPFDVDMRVAELLDNVRGVDAARRDHLISVLGVDVDWHMHAVSDGQRKRVQILLGLLKPSELLLLDEVTTDLDLLARRDLLEFLRQQSVRHGTTIVYASHILDRLEQWATDLIYMRWGRVHLYSPVAGVPQLQELMEQGASAPLATLIEAWLERDLSPDSG